MDALAGRRWRQLPIIDRMLSAMTVFRSDACSATPTHRHTDPLASLTYRPIGGPGTTLIADGQAIPLEDDDLLPPLGGDD